jgi:hypothetical protein
MKNIILVVLIFCAVPLILMSAEPVDLITGGSVFKISSSRNLEVMWRDKVLISGDSTSWIKDGNTCSTAEEFQISRTDGWTCSNGWSRKSPLPFRRETGLSPDSKKVEISFQSHLDALTEVYPSSVISYKIVVPLATLNNSTWDALTGRSYNAKWSSGTLDPSIADGDLIGAPARWVSFSTPDGKITFDFNPHGVPTYYVSGFNTIQSQWTIEKKGDFIELSFGTPPTNFGGAVTSKVVIFEGDKSDYLKHHAVSYYHYFSEIPAEKLFCFGERSSVAFTNAGTGSYEETKGYGWRNTARLIKSGDGLNGALHSSVSSSVKNTFITDFLRPGLYLVTLRSAAIAKNLGPFKVTLNDETIFSEIKVEKGNTATLTCVRWVEGGKAEIKFSGEWAVSVIGFQLFLHSEEDFVFRRGFWKKHDGYCPDIMFSNYFNTPPLYGKSVTFSKLAGKAEDIAEIPRFPELETALPDQKSDGLLWRYTSPLGTLGPDNSGSFNEFNTDDLIKKRLGQIREGGVEAVILNGFLSRHTFPVHLQRVEENIRKIVETGHRMGMKFLDHQDLTILWNMDMGFRFLAAHPEYLQHSVTNGLPTWGICPVNPLFRDEYFFPYILDHIRKTELDGIMIDECTFHGSNFCNCDHCRENFTKTTGLMLPDDETSPILRNRNSKLWKAWIEWRKNTIAKWRIDLSKATREINPDFCNIQYYSEGGFMLDYASYEQGGDLALSARSMDFLGTEIMSRDVWDDYRYNFSSRHMYNSLRETYGSPVFGLVYPAGQVNSAIIGWAMNNMLGQVTWSLGGEDEFVVMDNYKGWKENMNNLSARPSADVAIIFSRKTRDWSVNNKDSYSEELMGTSQFLSGKQIQHTFILDDALLNQDLSRFRIMLASGMECLSDEQAEKLKSYVNKGGTLFLTGEAGRFTSFGEPRETWIFGDILNDDTLKSVSDTSLAEVVYGKGKLFYCTKRYGLNEYCSSFTLGNTYRFSPDPVLTALNEKLFRRVFGTQLSFKPVSMPTKVFASVYEEIRDGKKITLVHLLNALGVKAKDGDILPLPSTVWDRIKGEMIFEISLPSVSGSYYATPDTPGHKPVQVQKLSEGRFKITVPEGTVDKYGIIYLLQ